MAMNMDAVLRIAAKVTGTREVAALQEGLGGLGEATNRVNKAFGDAPKNASEGWKSSAVRVVALTAAIGTSVAAAIEFESALANVRKVVDGIESPAALKQISTEIIELSNQMPIAAEGFAEIYAAAGASGIARDELKSFAVLVAQVATAFDMTAQQAGQSLAQLRVSLGLSTEEVGSLADMMNYLENNTGSSASQLVEFMTRSGAVGKIVGLTAGQTAAFGAAMIQAGFDTEVAATSFNNMVKALSKGPSMTERQVDALGRLGYAVVIAADEERKLTFAVEAESDRRTDTYRQETDSLLKEIGRRYRNQLQMLEDGWDDESRAFERKLQKQSEAQIRQIQDSKRMSDKAKDEAIDRIRDQMEDELTQYRRAQRDRQQVQRDRLDDEKQAEIDAANAKFKEVERVEKVRAEEAKAQAKKSAEGTADAWKQTFADRMEKDAIGTITEVLGRISKLPQSQQLSVISDLFGDEARALAPLISNMKELDRIIKLSGEDTKAAGSVLKEYATRSATAENQLALLNNAFTGLRIELGNAFLPALKVLLPPLVALINASTGLVIAIKPLIATVSGLLAFGYIVPSIVSFGSAIAGIFAIFTSTRWIAGLAIFAALPGPIRLIAGALTLLGVAASPLGPILNAVLIGLTALQFVNFARNLTAFIPATVSALTGFLGFLSGTVLPAILAFFSGPAGWTVLAIAAVVAMAIAFREPITQFFQWLGGAIADGIQALWDWGEPVRQFWAGVWDGIVDLADYSLDTLGKGVEAWWRGVQRVWGTIAQFFNTYVIRPIQQGWDNMVQALPRAMTAAVNMVREAWRAVLQFIANQINAVTGLVNRVIQGYNNIPVAADIPLIPTITVPAFAEGGYVRRPTLAMVGEGREPEYIIPESKMAAASANYLAGGRGADVIPTAAPATTSNQATPVINIRTGPVMEFNGDRYVTMRDFERGMRQTAEGVIGRLRTPAARAALGRA